MATQILKDDWVTVKEAAEALGLHRDTVRRRAERELEKENPKYRRFGDGPTSPIHMRRSELERLMTVYGVEESLD